MTNFINLHISNDDPKIKSICTRYWSINSEGEFTETNTKKICQDFGLNNYQLTKIIKENTVVTSGSYGCEGCDELWKITSRTQYLGSVKSRIRFRYRSNICDSCKDKARLQAIEQSKQEQVETEKRNLVASEELILINASIPSFCIEDLEFKELVFLKTLLDHSGSESVDTPEEYRWYKY